MKQTTQTWQPAFRLDLKNADRRQLLELVEKFAAWKKKEPPTPLTLADGWHTITPQLAEQLLLNNAANREPVIGTIVYYANQMRANDWMETGQPIIIDDAGAMDDGQHRAFGGYLSGASFVSYVVNVKATPRLFAYIDNGKVRTIRDALSTAGLNGLSGTIGQVIKIAVEHDSGAYVNGGKKLKKLSVPRLSPIHVIDYAETHPNVQRAARLMAGEHRNAADMIGHRDVASFMAFKIIELHDEATLDSFMEELADTDTAFPSGSPVEALQVVLQKDHKADKPMTKIEVLAHVIKGFNSWVNQELVKKISLNVNEEFPIIEKAAEAQEEAEAA